MDIRISNLILRVSDLERSIAFWRDEVGLDLSFASGEFAFFGVGDTTLALNQPVIFTPNESDTEIVFEFPDVMAAYAEMSGRGVRFEVEPRVVTTDGDRSLLAAHFRDPDGNLASITGWDTAGD
jgi:catechol 2,3-dioxygenase-like lactoylglutathione lyase family enzyme